MKLNSTGILTAAAIMFMGTNANANLLFDIYGGASFGVGGTTMFIDDEHPGFSATSYGALLGVDLPLFRVEGEYNFIDTSDMDLNLAMLNAYFKIPTPMIKPYFGAGVGTVFDGKYEPNSLTSVETESAMAYAGMLGLTVDLPMLPFTFDIEGRIVYANDVFELVHDNADLLHYEGRLKVRYVF